MDNLNYEQRALLRRLSFFINGSDKGIFGVYGSGGTGKTFTVTKLPNVEDFVFLAPTNKAAKEVNRNLKKDGFKTKCITVDRFFGYRLTMDENNKPVVNYKNLDELDLSKVIVIDEISMLNNNHFRMISHLSIFCKIIAIGDYLQLPPVEQEKDKYIGKEGYECSRVFEIVDESFELTIPNRQREDSHLYNMILTFRKEMHRLIIFKKFIDHFNNNIDVQIYDLNSKEFVDFVRNESFTILAHKKSSVSYLSYKVGSIRKNDKNFNIRSLTEGSYYYFERACFTEDRTFYTSEVVMILDISEKEIQFTFPVTNKIFNEKVRIASIADEYGKPCGEVMVSNSNLISKVNNHRRANANIGKYSKSEVSKMNTWHNDFKNKFAHFEPIIGTTIHKSQGSTYDKVLIPVFDFYENATIYKVLNQIFYVGISRAKTKIIFVKGRHNFGDHKRRVIFTEEERNMIASLSDFSCSKCDHKFVSDRDFEIHHIVPLESEDKKGNNSIGNLTALCKPCHKKHHSK
jgi:exodeoxyribonuclease V